jgi:hypothetical protein
MGSIQQKKKETYVLIGLGIYILAGAFLIV